MTLKYKVNNLCCANCAAKMERSINKLKGVKEVFLEVRRSNLPAINLYKSNGYQKISERKNYYGNEDALIFKKDL